MERVAVRVSLGGHDVPAGKLQPRYDRSLSLLPNAIRHSSRSYLFDNSGKSHRLIAEYDAGRLARSLIEANRDKIEAMTKALLEWETIDADQINDIMAGNPPREPRPSQASKSVEPPKDETPTAPATNQHAEGV